MSLSDASADQLIDLWAESLSELFDPSIDGDYTNHLDVVNFLEPFLHTLALKNS